MSLLSDVVESQRGWYIRETRIHGPAVYASREFQPGEKIGIVLYFVKGGTLELTNDFGIFVNQCTEKANTQFVGLGEATFGRDPIWIAATQNIHTGDEITLNYKTSNIKSVFTPPRRMSSIEC